MSSSSSTSSASAAVARDMIHEGWEDGGLRLPVSLNGETHRCFTKAGAFGVRRCYIFVATTVRMVDDYHSFLCSVAKGRPFVVGFDTEYQKRASWTQLCVVQEAFLDPESQSVYALVIPLLAMYMSRALCENSVPVSLYNLMKCTNLVFGGNGVQDDVATVIRQYAFGSIMPATLDFSLLFRLSHVADNLDNCKLYTLAERLLGCSVDHASKSRNQRSDWTEPSLSREQLIYAGLDAIIGAMLGERVVRNMAVCLPVPDEKKEERAPDQSTVVAAVMSMYAHGALDSHVPFPKGVQNKINWIRNSYHGLYMNLLRDNTYLTQVAEKWEKNSKTN